MAGGLGAGASAHRLVGVDGVQPLVAAMQVHLGEDGGEAAVGGLLAVVVALQVEEVGNGVHGWAGDRQSLTWPPPSPHCAPARCRAVPVKRASA